MRAHDAPARANALVAQALHRIALIDMIGQADTEALPVGARPVWFMGKAKARNARKQFAVTRGKIAAAPYDVGKAGQLPAADRCLNIGQAIIVTLEGKALEDDALRAVADIAGNVHAMLAQAAKQPVIGRLARRQHAAFTRRHDLCRMKGETGDIAMRSADTLPGAIHQNFRAGGAGGIFDDGYGARAGDPQNFT